MSFGFQYKNLYAIILISEFYITNKTDKTNKLKKKDSLNQNFINFFFGTLNNLFFVGSFPKEQNINGKAL